MKWLCLVVVFLLLVTGVVAEELHYVQGLDIRQTIRSGVEVTPVTQNYMVESAYLDLYLFAQADSQQELLSNSFPAALQEQNKLRFSWANPVEKDLLVEVSQDLRVRPTTALVLEKIPFPLDPLPPEIASYVAFTPYIDRSPEIAAVAQSLAAGEDDLFLLQHKIADWVTSRIEYNLSTITLEANIPSSQVLAQGYGVCDEITNLFLSINRELGIPARFVSGIAYSESILFDTNWGNHGWAEVYFPGVGWVPYDVTYGQFGWIDPTHIALSKEVDGATPALKAQTVGYGYEFDILPLEFDTTILNELPKRSSRTEVSVQAYEPAVSIGSFNAMEVTVTNENNYYVSETFRLLPTQNLESLGPSTVRVALAPGETQQLIFPLQVEEALDPGFRYTFPLGVRDSFGYEYRSEFTVQEENIFVQREFLPEYTSLEVREQNIICVGPGEVIIQSSAGITCALHEDATRVRDVCFGENCQRVDFENNVSFPVPTDTLGVFTQTLTSGSESVIVSYRVTDIPAIHISPINISQGLSGAPTQLSFTVEKASYTIPRNVVVILEHALFEQTWDIDGLAREQPIALAIPQQLFTWGENEFLIRVTADGQELARKQLVVNNTPRGVEAMLFAGVNSGNAKLADLGIKDALLRSAITLTLAGLVVFVIFSGVFRLLRRLISKP